MPSTGINPAVIDRNSRAMQAGTLRALASKAHLAPIVTNADQTRFGFQRPISELPTPAITSLSAYLGRPWPAAPTVPVAVVDLGSHAAKMSVVKPNGQVQIYHYSVLLGSNLGATGKIGDSGKQSLLNALNAFGTILEQQGVSPRQVMGVATAWARDAQNSKEMRQILNDSGLNIRVIPGTTEALLAFKATLRNQPLEPQEKVVVLEMGGGSSELCFGTGHQFDEQLSDEIPLGLSRLNLHNPFDPNALAQARAKIRHILTTEMPEKTRQNAQGRRLFIETFELQQKILQGVKDDLGLNTSSDAPLTQEHLGYLLRPEHLPLFQKHALLIGQQLAATPDTPTDQDGDIIRGVYNSAKNTIRSLLVIQSLLEYLNLPQAEYGAPGGMSTTLLLGQLAKATQPA